MFKHSLSYSTVVKIVVIALVGILVISACSSILPTLPATVVVPSAVPTVATDTPVATNAPSATAAPSATIAPTATEEPTATNAPSATVTVAVKTIKIQTSDKDGMVMVYVPAGDFLMGSDPAKDINTAPEEQPQHTITLKAYWIDQTDVTNAMFAAFVKATSYKTDAEKGGSGWAFTNNKWENTNGADWQHPQGPGSSLQGLAQHPVVLVSWTDAQAYCQWAGRRLPTEAEWEKAARGTDGRIFPWGDQPPAANLLNFADKNLPLDWTDKSVNDGYEFTSPVGSYPAGASPYGALDMAGNAIQWVADLFSGKYYPTSPMDNPTGPASGDAHVVRGGSWTNDLISVRSASRSGDPADHRSASLGFRCAVSP